MCVVIRSLLLLMLLCFPATAEMRGHGGPVRAIAVSPDGRTAVTGSFDTTLIIWDLEAETARQVLRFHEGPVNTVQFLGDNQFISASDDGRLALWALGGAQPSASFGQPGVPVTGLLIGPASITALFADRTMRSFAFPGGTHDPAERALKEQPLAIARSGEDSIIAQANATLRWQGSGRSVSLPTNANTLISATDGEIIAGGADGTLSILRPDGTIRLNVAVQELPITSLALSRDDRLIAAAGLRGAVTILERVTGKTQSTLVGPGLPVWSLAFLPDGKTLLTGGADRILRKWDVATGQPLTPAQAPKADFPAALMQERGAQVFRACEACHTVTPDGGNRAGPSLHKLFGRTIGTAQGYIYSADFAKHAITWNGETITKLFREGPASVTPGTKMPEQRITDPEDLAALVNWLEKVTR